MRQLRSLIPVLLVCALVAGARSTYAAAQLKAGAKTSAAPTSTNPQERAIQITFDPAVIPDSETDGPPTDTGYDVNAFQLSVSFDSSLMTVGSINGVGPFNDVSSTPENPPSDISTAQPADLSSGLLDISGDTGDDPTAAGPGDVNIFSVTFILNSDVSFDTALNFSIFGSDDPNTDNPESDAGVAGPDCAFDADYIQGYDPTTGQYATTYGSNITPTFLTTTFNQATQATSGGSSTPLPSGALAGVLALACSGWIARRSIKTALPARV
jgi:archaellum component FlaG (FlaF/FlaG flagellin family)